MRFYIRVITCFGATFAAGLIGALFVSHGVNTWYNGLTMPPLSPPDVLFPIAWLILYVLMAIAASIVWLKDPQNSHTEIWLRFYFIQLLFNAGWTIFFFGFHATVTAVFDVLFLCFVAIALIASAWEIDKRVSYLLIPYFLWLVFAAYLNVGIWALN